ncbi:hypothetical protein BBO99_00000624 [Phytophthora kernoviae]|uniref:Uncharacterized protein n=2 Tax=Phytophthora kernoviae TaxID=325452 RepID=A0A421FEX7_9STRA|nr:hypothetical protein G195_001631 [Phytophthora kernoviae 00238/432]KAG2530726.1 hypothetical protein JM16_001457 [Phytophthora kernoviae]KAG2532943.1 hypothetical protein JM18_000902 [Phytophthora kernoviae]RLN43797.1 hypothetical protein BBI17_001441 [Phytophthora kernoviae]RLN85378.1 hypothetical protein BBO99_00000624 [Phytophthora kernoviae]
MAFQFPVASGKKKKVQVFECPTESWKERKPNSAKDKAKEDTPELSVRQEIRKEFDDTFDSVLEFASSNLKGKERKAHEAKKIEALGGKGAKNRSVPYKMLIGMKTKGVARKQRREELIKEADVVTGKRKSTNKSRDQQKRKKVDFGVQATKGRFKGGVLDVRGLDIVTKIHHWQQCSQTDAKSKAPRNSVKLHDLFSGTPMKEPKPKDNIPPSSAEIQLSRLLDDYMLGAQGDYIIQQMEDLTTDDDPPSLATSPNTQRVQAKSFGDLEANINKKGHVEPLPNLDNMMSMEDFEKYIANN